MNINANNVNTLNLPHKAPDQTSHKQVVAHLQNVFGSTLWSGFLTAAVTSDWRDNTLASRVSTTSGTPLPHQEASQERPYLPEDDCKLSTAAKKQKR